MAVEDLGEPRTNQELYRLLEKGRWISPDLAATMQRITGFRNVLVHGYDDVDLGTFRSTAGLDRAAALHELRRRRRIGRTRCSFLDHSP